MGSSAGSTAKSYMDRQRNSYAADDQMYNPDRDVYGNAAKGAVSAYQGAMYGVGPSVAQEQLKQSTQANIANQAAIAASTRGRDPAAAARQQAMNTAAINQQANSQAAMLRADEMEKARAGLSGLATSNLQRMDTKTANQEGLINNAGQIGVSVGNAETAANNGIMKGIGDALPYAAMAFSDENLKTDVKDGDKKVGKFLDSIKAYSYKYKEGVAGKKGEHVSPMAQDLEKSEMGKDMVKDTPVGKVVDYAQGFGAMLAAQAELNDRLKKLEKKRA